MKIVWRDKLASAVSRKMRKPGARILGACVLACACVFLALLGSGVIKRIHLKERAKHFVIIVKGDTSFQQNVYRSLAMLERDSPSWFSLVTQYTSVIYQDDRVTFNYANVWIDPPIVSLTSDTATNTQWCASSLVHESTHLRQLEQSKLRNAGMIVVTDLATTNAEIEANIAGAETLRELGAPSYMSDYLLRDQDQSWLHSLGAYVSALALTNPVSAPVPMKVANPSLWAELRKIRRGIESSLIASRVQSVRGAALGTAPSHYEQGIAYVNAHLWDAGISEFDQWIRDHQEDSTAFEYRGGAYFGKGDLEHALADLSRAVGLSPANARALYSRGVAHWIRNEFTNAILDLTRSLDLNPTNSLAYRVRASVYVGQREFDRALEDVSQALQLSPGDSIALALRGHCRAKKGEFENAIQDYTEAIRVDSKNDTAYNDLAWLLATCPTKELRDSKRSTACATRACELTNWRDWKCLDTLAAALAQDGDFTNAVKYEEQVLAVGTLSSDERINLLQIVSQYRQNNPNRDSE